MSVYCAALECTVTAELLLASQIGLQCSDRQPYGMLAHVAESRHNRHIPLAALYCSTVICCEECSRAVMQAQLGAKTSTQLQLQLQLPISLNQTTAFQQQMLSLALHGLHMQLQASEIKYLDILNALLVRLRNPFRLSCSACTSLLFCWLCFTYSH